MSRNKLRITGPFTVEAVPFATVLALDEAEQPVEKRILRWRVRAKPRARASGAMSC